MFEVIYDRESSFVRSVTPYFRWQIACQSSFIKTSIYLNGLKF